VARWKFWKRKVNLQFERTGWAASSAFQWCKLRYFIACAEAGGAKLISDQEMLMIGFLRSMALATAVTMVTTMSVSAAEIHVMSGGAPKEVFALLAPRFEQQTGNKVDFTCAVITELREKLSAGATADVLVLPTPVLDSLAKDGKVRADTRAIFGTVGISVVVKEGAPRPDISSKEKFRDTMLAARSVVHATPGKTPSGTHLGKVMEQLGIADAMGKKVIFKPALDGGAQLVVSGQAEIGIYPASEVAGCAPNILRVPDRI
jgi:molybdate transport system substrate-binding protein